MPSIDTARLEAHRDAHAQLHEMLSTAHPGVARLFKTFAHRTTVSAIAHVRMTFRSIRRPPLFPPPRSFLSPVDHARLAGCAAAYRYIDSRLAMITLGIEQPPALCPESPYVVHALTEGRIDNPRETNPGMIRGYEFEHERLPMAPYPPPQRARCRALLQEAVEVAADSDGGMPAAVRAAWLLFAIGEIHPFVDGNGRVARLLHLLVAGEDLPLTVDWGVSEQIRYYSDRFLASLSQRDPGPAVETVVDLSTDGARLMAARLGAMGVLVPELARRLGITVGAGSVVFAAWLRRAARADELSIDLGAPYAAVVADAEALIGHGVLERRPTRPAAQPAYPTYALTPETHDQLGKLLRAIEEHG